VSSLWSPGTRYRNPLVPNALTVVFLAYAAGMSQGDRSTVFSGAPVRHDESTSLAQGVLRTAMLRHPRATDAAISLVALGWVYFEQNIVGLSAPLSEQLDGPLFAISALACAVLMLRRSLPVATAAATFLACAALVTLGRPVALITLAIALYSLGVYRSNRTAIVGAVATAGALAGITYAKYPTQAQAGDYTQLVIEMAAFVGIGSLLGVNIGNVRRNVRALMLQAEQQSLFAVADERNRITREMHDVIAHGLSVMVQLADGAEAAAEADPVRSRLAVHQIGLTGRQCLADVRRVLGMLHDPGAEIELAPQPSLRELDALTATYTAAGLPVVLRREGEPPSDPALQLLVYRAVQESLTNALRYAIHPTRVLVEVRADEHGVRIHVCDDGSRGSEQATAGPGRGLIGLRERAALFGGALDAGPNAGPGWHTTVEIPIQMVPSA
jgi:signal transduction histidine kinase